MNSKRLPFKKQALDKLTDWKRKGEDRIWRAKRDYEESNLKPIIDEGTQKTKKFMDETGITAKVEKITETTSDHLDKISGKKILDLVESRLQLQSDYNNILATKLEEALERIEQLETQLSQMSKKQEFNDD